MIVDHALTRTLDHGAMAAVPAPRQLGTSRLSSSASVDAAPAEEADASRLAQAVKDMNEFIQQSRPSILFSLDEDTGRTVVKMIDTETNEVVRQIPTKEALAISKALDRLTGMTVNLEA